MNIKLLLFNWTFLKKYLKKKKRRLGFSNVFITQTKFIFLTKNIYFIHQPDLFY